VRKSLIGSVMMDVLSYGLRVISDASKTHTPAN